MTCMLVNLGFEDVMDLTELGGGLASHLNNGKTIKEYEKLGVDIIQLVGLARSSSPTRHQ